MQIRNALEEIVLKQSLDDINVLEGIWAVSENRQRITNSMIYRVKWSSWSI